MDGRALTGIPLDLLSDLDLLFLYGYLCNGGELNSVRHREVEDEVRRRSEDSTPEVAFKRGFKEGHKRQQAEEASTDEIWLEGYNLGYEDGLDERDKRNARPMEDSL